MNEMNWTPDQWKLMECEINTETENSRLAHKIFLNKNKLPFEARAVSRDTFNYETGMVDETYDTIFDSPEQVLLTKEQTEDADLCRAKLIVRRAAQRLARTHDRQVFVDTIRNRISSAPAGPQYHPVQPINPANGDGLIAAVASAIALLEFDGYRSGFVMVAGQNIYTIMHQRVPGAADLPRKALEGLLEGGPIHRSCVLDPNEALVLSVSGEEIDRTVAVDPTLEFRRVGDHDVRELRLVERHVCRFKQPRCAVLLRMEAKAQGDGK